MAAITAFGAVVLLVVLGAMEGLEVSVIDRWQKIWPGRSTHYLARWLAARQLFVASIVTAATLLANLNVLIIPWTSVKITDAVTLGVFDLAWTTFTVLWFAQIMPKHLGAMNPDRYLRSPSPVLFSGRRGRAEGRHITAGGMDSLRPRILVRLACAKQRRVAEDDSQALAGRHLERASRRSVEEVEPKP